MKFHSKYTCLTSLIEIGIIFRAVWFFKLARGAVAASCRRINIKIKRIITKLLMKSFENNINYLLLIQLWPGSTIIVAFSHMQVKEWLPLWRFKEHLKHYVGFEGPYFQSIPWVLIEIVRALEQVYQV